MLLKNILLMAFFSILVFFSCAPEAPHDNSLDPYHSWIGNNGIDFLGEVLSKNEPHEPISSCLVLVMPEQYYDTTNFDGRFQFNDLQLGVHQFIFEKKGFDRDTFFVNPDTISRTPKHFFLNGKPVIEQAKIYSEYIDQWWPDPFTRIIVELIIADPDGLDDIKDVIIEIPSIGITKDFIQTSKTDSFYVQLNEQDFPNENVYSMIGKVVKIVLEDKSKSRVYSDPHFLIRIIENAPLPIEPVGLQTVSNKPLLHWQPYTASFLFDYEISVFIVAAGLPVLIHNQFNIPVTQNEYLYPDSLSTGTYFWTVGVRDEIGNLSRSKEASFIVP